MIQNQHQYEITKRHLQSFQQALVETDRPSISPFPAVHPLLLTAQKAALQSVISDLQEEIEEYESEEQDWGGGGDYGG